MTTRRVGAALAALVAVAVLGLTGCDDARGGGDASLAVGDVVDGGVYLAGAGAEYAVWLPVGQTTFEVMDPVHHLAADDTDGGTPIDAPSGTALLGIEWTRTETFLDPDAEALLTGTDDPAQADPARLWVVADGERHEVEDVGTLGGPSGRGSPVYVVVPDDADGLALEVEHSGLAQTVDLSARTVDRGRGRDLAGVTEPSPAGLHFVDCSDGLRGLRAHVATCLVDGQWRTPYLHDRGWADPGHTWVVVDASLTIGAPGVSGTDLAGRLDGRRPVAVDVEDSSEIGTTERLVFEVPTGEHQVLTLRATLGLEGGGAEVGAGRTALRW